jgi:hypothetical protein
MKQCYQIFIVFQNDKYYYGQSYVLNESIKKDYLVKIRKAAKLLLMTFVYRTTCYLFYNSNKAVAVLRLVGTQ